LEAKEMAGRLTLEEIRPMMEKVLAIHERDPNFPFSIIERISAFLGKFAMPLATRRPYPPPANIGLSGNDDIFENPEKHAVLIEEMKLEAALITVNSPYAEVRAVVDNHDDVDIPCGTIRAVSLVLSRAAAASCILTS
jgi:hypothetical protein